MKSLRSNAASRRLECKKCGHEVVAVSRLIAKRNHSIMAHINSSFVSVLCQDDGCFCESAK